MNAGRVSPSLALAAYAETWISGAKVIVFGDSLSPLPERLVERGARHVQVYDRDAARAAEATAERRSKQVSYAALEDAGSTLRDGVFDFGIIEDLAAAQQDPDLLLKPLGRALSRRGMALIAARNPEIAQRLIACSLEAEQPLGYYDLYDTVSQHFDEVRMLGQTAFVGYAVADFSASEAADVRIDTAFLPNGAEEPEWFLALVSALPVSADSFSVIQIPFADVQLPTAVGQQVPREIPRAQAQSAAKIAELQAELASREEWLTGLESRASTADQRADEMQSELDQLTADATRAKQELAKREQRLEEEVRAKKALEESTRALKQELDKLRKATDTDADGARALKQELDKLRKAADTDADGARALKQELDKLRKAADTDADGARALKQELDKLRKAADTDADGARALKQELDKLRKSADTDTRKASKLEAEARSLTQRVEQLTAELRASEQRLAQRGAPDDEATSELRELEARLEERAGEVTRLTDALHKTERFGRQLIAELNQLKATPDTDSVKQDLTRLAQRNAELEANLEAARWTISSLQSHRGDEPTGPALAKRRDEAGGTEPHRSPGAD